MIGRYQDLHISCDMPPSMIWSSTCVGSWYVYSDLCLSTALARGDVLRCRLNEITVHRKGDQAEKLHTLWTNTRHNSQVAPEMLCPFLCIGGWVGLRHDRRHLWAVPNLSASGGNPHCLRVLHGGRSVLLVAARL